MPTENYDPYADLITANQDQVVKMYGETLRRVRTALEKGNVPLAIAVIEAMNKYHPMHEESWCGWPNEG